MIKTAKIGVQIIVKLIGEPLLNSKTSKGCNLFLTISEMKLIIVWEKSKKCIIANFLYFSS